MVHAGRDPETPAGWVKPMTCPECRSTFVDEAGLGTHLERHREVLPRGPVKSVRRRGTEPPGIEPTTWECRKGCGRHLPLVRGDISAEWKDHESRCDGQPPIRKGTSPSADGGARGGPPDSPKKAEREAAPSAPPASASLPSAPPAPAADVPDVKFGIEEDLAQEREEEKTMASLKCEQCDYTTGRAASLGAHKYRAHGAGRAKKAAAKRTPARKPLNTEQATAIAANGASGLIANMRAEAAAIRKRLEQELAFAKELEEKASEWEDRFRVAEGAGAAEVEA